MNTRDDLQQKKSAKTLRVADKLRLRKNLILGVCCLTLILGATYISFQTVQYTATATLQIPESEKTTTDSVLEALRSEDVLIPVIEKQNLEHRAHFNTSLHPDETLYTEIKNKIIKKYKIGKQPRNLREKILFELQDNVSVKTSNNTNGNIMRISYTNPWPDMSAQIANGIAREYLSLYFNTKGKNLLEEAKFPAVHTAPNITISMFVFGVIGLILGTCLALSLPTPNTKKGSVYVR